MISAFLDVRLGRPWIQELKLGAKVENQRREPSRGAEGAKGGGVWRGGVPFPTGECSLPRKFFGRFWEKVAYFRALLVINFVLSVTKTV